MPAQASGLVQAAAQSPQAQRDGPNECEVMRSFVVNAHERHWCGDDIFHSFGPRGIAVRPLALPNEVTVHAPA
ncbi:MAG TPA: hypothetical protein VGM05_02275 [Planctomycetaceae bacterium]|jgi:hypothetical protein